MLQEVTHETTLMICLCMEKCNVTYQVLHILGQESVYVITPEHKFPNIHNCFTNKGIRVYFHIPRYAFLMFIDTTSRHIC